MFQGVLKPLTSLMECQKACLEERNCLGVDWNKLESATDSRRCYFVYPESTRYGVQPASDYCCDHYRRTYCLSTSVPRPGDGNTTTTARPPWPQQHPALVAARQCAYLMSVLGLWVGPHRRLIGSHIEASLLCCSSHDMPNYFGLYLIINISF